MYNELFFFPLPLQPLLRETALLKVLESLTLSVNWLDWPETDTWLTFDQSGFLFQETGAGKLPETDRYRNQTGESETWG